MVPLGWPSLVSAGWSDRLVQPPSCWSKNSPSPRPGDPDIRQRLSAVPARPLGPDGFATLTFMVRNMPTHVQAEYTARKTLWRTTKRWKARVLLMAQGALLVERLYLLSSLTVTAYKAAMVMGTFGSRVAEKKSAGMVKSGGEASPVVPAAGGGWGYGTLEGGNEKRDFSGSEASTSGNAEAMAGCVVTCGRDKVIRGRRARSNGLRGSKLDGESEAGTRGESSTTWSNSVK